jgi:predicted MPP superfamily phosphohydrolase
MLTFILIFFTLYGILHLYLYRKITSAFEPGAKGRTALALLLCLNLFSPVLWRLIDSYGNPQITFYIAFTSLFLMGLLIYFFLSGLILDLISRFVKMSRRKRLILTALITLILGAYSHLETYRLEVLRYSIQTSKLPPGEEIRILHISDMHLGPVMREDRVRMVLEVYEKVRPHLVVATGDMVDGNMKGHDGLAQMLARMDPPLGKFAVLGNHEFYRGFKQAIDFLERSGFEVLRSEGKNVGKFLFVAGVDDRAGLRLGAEAKTDEIEALKNIDGNRFTIFLKHEPTLSPEALRKTDLFLAGHTHGGVLFFVGYTVLRLMYFTDRGIKEIAPGKYVIVSKGVGTGGPPMRLLSPPDVVVIRLMGRRRD